jgi:hypothetical protein
MIISLLFEKVCVCVGAHARRNSGGGRWSLTIATEQRMCWATGRGCERAALGWFHWQWRRLWASGYEHHALAFYCDVSCWGDVIGRRSAATRSHVLAREGRAVDPCLLRQTCRADGYIMFPFTTFPTLSLIPLLFTKPPSSVTGTYFIF